jgi:farnesyl-diphosphate farnesyltransferase
MICDATRHAPKCLEYMAQLKDPQVFKFCAIPQIMAIATLQQCFNNGKLFEGVVKMRRGQTAKVAFAT